MGNVQPRHIMATMLVVLVFSPAVAVDASPSRASTHGELAVDRLVRDVCDKRIVMLGEDSNHGSGATLDVKTQIVERLVNRCGFKGVLFESSFYEFTHFERLVNQHTATSKNLADSIGATWTAAAESEALVEYLYAGAVSGTLKVGGLDPQVGSSTAQYEATRLAGDLVKYLAPDQRQSCMAALDRNDRWGYDDAHPYDAAAKQEMFACIVSTQAALAKDREKDESAATAAAMARSYEANLKMISAPVHGSSDASALRDRAMFENLQWILERWPRDCKVIIWIATVHAIKGRTNGKRSGIPLGAYVHETYGNQAAAIGFSALAGAYGRPDQPPSEIPTASSGSLEASACAAASVGPCYVDSDALRSLGSVPGRALNYAQPIAAPWATLLDGVVVLRNEHPMTLKAASESLSWP